MEKIHKEYDGDSGPDWILNLEGPDGNVYYLWALLEKYIDADAIEESKNNPPFEGYEGVLDYCLDNLTGCGPAIEFRMYGRHIQQVVPDYRSALSQ